MADRPITFRPDMVRAIIDGRKRQTRRPRKGDTSRIEVGDRLWVRETHRHIGNIYTAGRVTEHVQYKGEEMALSHEWTGEDKPPTRTWWNMGRSPWTPARFMPKRYARLWLRVTNVRVERVQDISEEDARAEGAQKWLIGHGTVDERFGEPAMLDSARYNYGFEVVWFGIYAEKPGLRWDDNPWVWVYEFEVVSCSTASTLPW